MIVYEDKNFKILKRYNDYVLIRKNRPYSFHSHFRNLQGAKIVIGFFNRGMRPNKPYFISSMQRITTVDEYDAFGFRKKKMQYRNNSRR